jgi:hypothetical protein
MAGGIDGALLSLGGKNRHINPFLSKEVAIYAAKHTRRLLVDVYDPLMDGGTRYHESRFEQRTKHNRLMYLMRKK